MQAKVQRLRERGQRLPDQQIAAALPVEGQVWVYGIGGVILAALSDPACQVGDPLIPILHEGRLTTMAPVFCSRGRNGRKVIRGQPIFKWPIRLNVA